MLGLVGGAAFLLAASFGTRVLPGLGLLVLSWILRSRTLNQSRYRLAFGAAILVLALIGAALGPEREPESVVLPPDARAVRGEVRSGVERVGSRQRFLLDVHELQGSDWQWRESRGLLRVSAPRLPEVRAGDSVRLAGRLSPLAVQPSGYRLYLRQQGIDATFGARTVIPVQSGHPVERFFDGTRFRIDEVLRIGAPGDAGVFLAGLVTGDDDSLSSKRKEAFRVAGLAHVTAISGSNIALLIAILAGGTGLHRQRRSWRLGAAVLAIWIYALVVQLEPPVVRAALVATLALVGVRSGRRPDYVTLTVLTAVFMVLVQPAYLLGLSFQLSFVSALALVISAPRTAAQSTAMRVLQSLLSVTVAHLATLPLLLPLQERLSLTALPANVLLGPVVAALFAVALLAGVVGLIWPPVGESLAATAGVFAEMVLRAVDVLGMPAAALPLWGLSMLTLVWLGLVSMIVIWGFSGEGTTLARRWWSEHRISPSMTARR
ncbi:MAG TPA: ComEC/Rec2 family competence protein [Thermomicrobiales bacterium]|nr:ComEC/Rec2 family competence protein [Thermomicrobiales bacterium]